MSTRHDSDHDAALLRRVGTLGVPVEDGARVAARRARLVPELGGFAEAAFASRARSHRRARLGSVAVISVAAAAVTLFAARLHRAKSGEDAGSGSVFARDGSVRVGGDGFSSGSARALASSDLIETGRGRADVRLASGASVEASPETRLEVRDPPPVLGVTHEEMELTSGQVMVSVPKLGRGSLVVNTPNARVTVHGTRFSVEVRPASAASSVETRVAVSEGIVSVASDGHEVFLRPGARWSSVAAPAQLAEPDAGAPFVPALTHRTGSTRRSTLGSENELFRAAIAARRGGDPARAIALVDELLSEYPTSPLSGQARAERERAERDLSPSP